MSTLAQLRVERAGPLSTLQDAGRFGVRRLGLTQGGPVDIHAWAWANRLLGNAWGAAALEITFGGLSLLAEATTSLALAGADLGARLDDAPLDPWSSFTVEAGQRLTLASPSSGLRAYLAAPGGFIAEPVLGSTASVSREELGGHDGQGGKLRSGDVLIFRGELRDTASLAAQWRPDYSQPATLSLVPGAQIADFEGTSLFAAFNRAWHVDE
ncbi:MAG TPA: allophanate hydrolase, partial [Modicisalibacter sp.]|nr:allophanate hydrolase [Modicisalibacter sp.]